MNATITTPIVIVPEDGCAYTVVDGKALLCTAILKGGTISVLEEEWGEIDFNIIDEDDAARLKARFGLE